MLKCSNNYRCAFFHLYAFMNALRNICTVRVQLKFERSAERYVNSTNGAKWDLVFRFAVE